MKDIRSIYDIDIQHDSSNDVYHIAEEGEHLSNSKNRMLEAYDLFNALNISDHMKDYIRFEQRTPQGTQHFIGILQAIKNAQVLKITHQGFWADKPKTRQVMPYLLKESKGRWYLVAEDPGDKIIKSFGLDRISDSALTKKKFKKMDVDTIDGLFDNCFGIVNPTNKKPENLILSFSPRQGKYVKTYPLHETQSVLVDDDKEYRIQLKLRITEDLIMELLSHGWDLNIIAPPELRKQVKEILEGTLVYYAT